MRHVGSPTTPDTHLYELLAEGRLRDARLHERGPRYLAFRAAFVLRELVRLPLWSHAPRRAPFVADACARGRDGAGSPPPAAAGISLVDLAGSVLPILRYDGRSTGDLDGSRSPERRGPGRTRCDCSLTRCGHHP